MGIDIKKAFAFALARLKGNPLFYILGMVGMAIAIAIVTPVVSIVVSGALGAFSFVVKSNISSALELDAGSSNVLSVVLKVIAVLLGHQLPAFICACTILTPFQIGYFRGIQKEADGGRATLSDMLSGFKAGLPTLVFAVGVNALMALALACCAIPGLIFMPVMAMSFYYMAQDKGGAFGWNAIRLGAKAWTFQLLGLVALGILSALVIGALSCVVGYLLAIPFGELFVWHICHQRALELKESEPEAAASAEASERLKKDTQKAARRIGMGCTLLIALLLAALAGLAAYMKCKSSAEPEAVGKCTFMQIFRTFVDAGGADSPLFAMLGPDAEKGLAEIVASKKSISGFMILRPERSETQDGPGADTTKVRMLVDGRAQVEIQFLTEKTVILKMPFSKVVGVADVKIATDSWTMSSGKISLDNQEGLYVLASIFASPGNARIKSLSEIASDADKSFQEDKAAQERAEMIRQGQARLEKRKGEEAKQRDERLMRQLQEERETLEQAISGGTEAQRKYAEILVRNGKSGEAQEWFRRAASSGDALAMRRCAELLFRAGTDESLSEAFVWMNAAADGGSKEAADFVSAKFYGGSSDQEAKDKIAEPLYKRANGGGASIFGAANPQVVAYSNAALEKIDARNMERRLLLIDPANVSQEDYRYLNEAIAKGSAKAAYMLGLYHEKRSSKWDMRACGYFEIAAKRGSAEAMYHLGKYYEELQREFTRSSDMETSAAWYKKAAELGNEDAKQALKRLAK